MAQAWQAFPSGVPSNGYNRVDRTFVQVPESIGTPSEPAATDASAENSAFAMLRAICAGLDIPVGAGAANVNPNHKLVVDAAVTLGEPDDVAAEDTGRHSVISLMKGVLAVAERA